MYEVHGSTAAFEGQLLTQVELKYLRAVFKLGGCPGRGSYARFSEIARFLGVSAPTVSIMVRRLEDRGLLSVEPRRGVVITWKGLEMLAEYCWKTSVLEVALTKLGVPESYQRDLVEKMALTLDMKAVIKLWDCLGRPKACPHGSPLDVNLESTREAVEFLEKCCGLGKP
jgi:DtxR family Mn-dependent transcriptional regulator